jgi:pyruvate dehydrogenase E1 component beta subunit
VIYFEPKRVYRSFREEVPEDDYTIPIGEAKVVNEGTDLTVVTWGASLFQCLEAMDEQPEDVDGRADRPADHRPVGHRLRSPRASEDRAVRDRARGPQDRGHGRRDRDDLIQEHCFLHLEAPVQRVAGFDTIMPYYKLELDYLPDARRIGSAIGEVLAY